MAYPAFDFYQQSQPVQMPNLIQDYEQRRQRNELLDIQREKVDAQRYAADSKRKGGFGSFLYGTQNANFYKEFNNLYSDAETNETRGMLQNQAVDIVFSEDREADVKYQEDLYKELYRNTLNPKHPWSNPENRELLRKNEAARKMVYTYMPDIQTGNVNLFVDEEKYKQEFPNEYAELEKLGISRIKTGGKEYMVVDDGDVPYYRISHEDISSWDDPAIYWGKKSIPITTTGSSTKNADGSTTYYKAGSYNIESAKNTSKAILFDGSGNLTDAGMSLVREYGLDPNNKDAIVDKAVDLMKRGNIASQRGSGAAQTKEEETEAPVTVKDYREYGTTSGNLMVVKKDFQATPIKLDAIVFTDENGTKIPIKDVEVTTVERDNNGNYTVRFAQKNIKINNIPQAVSQITITDENRVTIFGALKEASGIDFEAELEGLWERTPKKKEDKKDTTSKASKTTEKDLPQTIQKSQYEKLSSEQKNKYEPINPKLPNAYRLKKQ